MSVVVRECSYILVPVPDFVRYGSKPLPEAGIVSMIVDTEKVAQKFKAIRENARAAHG